MTDLFMLGQSMAGVRCDSVPVLVSVAVNLQDAVEALAKASKKDDLNSAARVM